MKKSFGILIKISVLTLILVSAINIYAQTAGSLDTTFGTNGITETHLRTTATLFDLAVQPDGKILASGQTFRQDVATYTGVIARFNVNGTLDTTFDADGYNNNGFIADGSSVVLQPNGKILVGGTAISGNAYGFSVARLNTDGSLDTTFNGSGTAVTIIGTSPRVSSVNLQTDGKIIVAGWTQIGGVYDFALIRYNADGSLDTSFGTGGRQATDVSGNDYVSDAVIQPEGKIILVGSSTDQLANVTQATLVRYNADGSLDTTFGTGGKKIIPATSTAYISKVFLQPDGKIIFMGTNVALQRYNANGTPDVVFEASGTTALNLKVRADGKILTAGGGQSNFGLARYNPNGTLDQTFGTNGTVVSNFFGNTFITSTDFTPDGKIVAGGTGSNNNFEIVLARYFGDPSTRRAAFDFDGDGASDVSVFRPSNGTWFTSRNAAINYGAVQFGAAGDTLVPADYDGDGKTDIAVYRNGIWYLNRSTLGFTGVAFGAAEDVPMPADYDGDLKADIAVFRPSTGIWYLQRSQSGFTGVQFGQAGDKPVAADYDADGKADIAVFRSGIWYIQRSQLGFTGIAFGDSMDKLVPADYDGDGKTDVAVFRPSNGTWYLQQTTAGFTGVAFGLGTDLPTPGEYDGDGKTDIAVWRGGTWYLNRSSAGYTAFAFGAATDTPVPNAFVRSGN